jgi:beta-lactamase regulating signal transducer with metallopeptidase domain
MQVLVAIALKSLLIAGLAVGLLAWMKKRSAAERSWVAHMGLLALVVLAFAPLVLPSFNVEIPALFAQADVPVVAQPAPTPTVAPSATASTHGTTTVPAPASSFSLSPAAAATAIYALPAAVLLLITFLALARLIALRARADVLVDGHWLTALARAQKRMGFKHGTALLTSNALASPISWGLMRPVILLNNRAVEAAGEAEAIIAHELAHVARMDWVKLLLARVATALFWFNPFVWILAREAHQLREEAADDAVLAADISDTDYAQLLVGVARHECPGLLLGAHGVAPSQSSLARRVARVLDGKSVRGPVARSFGLGVFVGAALVAAPLAALTLSPKQPAAVKPALANGKVDTSRPYYTPTPPPSDLGHVIAQGVRTSVMTASAVIDPDEPDLVVDPDEIAKDRAEAARDMAIDRAREAAEMAREKSRDMQEMARELRKTGRSAQQALNITPEYIGGMRAASARLAKLQPSEFAGMRAVGVTPDYARSLAAAGFPNLSDDDLITARAIGLTGDYVRQLRNAGVRGNLDDFVEMRTMGINPAFVQRARQAGYTNLDAEKLVELQALGRVAAPAPPRGVTPPGGWGKTPPPALPARPVDPDDPDPDG